MAGIATNLAQARAGRFRFVLMRCKSRTGYGLQVLEFLQVRRLVTEIDDISRLMDRLTAYPSFWPGVSLWRCVRNIPADLHQVGARYSRIAQPQSASPQFAGFGWFLSRCLSSLMIFASSAAEISVASGWVSAVSLRRA